MNLSVLGNLGPGDVASGPFPYTATSETFPESVYLELAAARPEVDKHFKVKRGSNNKLATLGAVELFGLGVPEIWRRFLEFHISEAFRDEVWRVYGDAIRERNPDLEETRTWPVLPRGSTEPRRSSNVVRLDCQVCIDTPAKVTSIVRGPHVDNPCGLYAGLFYMRPDDIPSEGGDLILYEHKSLPAEWIGKAELRYDSVTELRRVEYRANQSVSWMNTLHSVHGVSPRHAGSGRRLFVNTLIEYPTKLFNAKGR